MASNGFVSRLQALFTGAVSDAAREPDPEELRQLRKEVVKGLIEVLHPVLNAAGFGGFANGTSWRHSTHWTDVIQIQFIRTEHTTPYSPSLHVGRFYHYMPQRGAQEPVVRRNDKYYPAPELCHIRKAVFKTVRDRKAPVSIWPIGPKGEGLEQCLAQALAMVKSHVLPWCRSLDNPVTALELVLRGISDAEGNSEDPLLCGCYGYESQFGQQVLGGMMAFQLGRWQLAAQLLQPVVTQGGTLGRGQRLVPLPPISLDQIGSALAQARAHL